MCTFTLIRVVLGAFLWQDLTSHAVSIQELKPQFPSGKVNSKITLNADVFPNEIFSFYHIPNSKSNTFMDFFFHSGNTSFCQGHFSTNDFVLNRKRRCTLYSLQATKDMTLYRFSLSNPSIRMMTTFRDPLLMTLETIDPVAELSDNCELTSFVHSDGCADLRNVTNKQTKYIGGENILKSLDMLKKMFWFGISELPEASLCLFSAQVGQYKKELCDCSSPSLLHLRFEKIRKARQKSTVLIEIAARIRKDKALYHKALVLFLSRVNDAERVTGSAMMCGDRDPEDIMEMKDMVSKGILMF